MEKIARSHIWHLRVERLFLQFTAYAAQLWKKNNICVCKERVWVTHRNGVTTTVYSHGTAPTQHLIIKAEMKQLTLQDCEQGEKRKKKRKKKPWYFFRLHSASLKRETACLERLLMRDLLWLTFWQLSCDVTCDFCTNFKTNKSSCQGGNFKRSRAQRVRLNRTQLDEAVGWRIMSVTILPHYFHRNVWQLRHKCL